MEGIHQTVKELQRPAGGICHSVSKLYTPKIWPLLLKKENNNMLKKALLVREDHS